MPENVTIYLWSTLTLLRRLVYSFRGHISDYFACICNVSDSVQFCQYSFIIVLIFVAYCIGVAFSVVLIYSAAGLFTINLLTYLLTRTRTLAKVPYTSVASLI